MVVQPRGPGMMMKMMMRITHMFLLQVNKMLMKIHRHHLCKRG
jgi:hypothetical protein